MLRRGIVVGLALAALAIAGARPAEATTVNYTTVGSFDCGAVVGCSSGTTAQGGATITINGLTITYTSAQDGLAFRSVDASPTTNADFGTVASSGTTGATSFLGTSFTMTLAQSVPSAGGSVYTSTITGSLSGTPNSSTVFVNFDAPFIRQIGFVTYNLIEDDGAGGIGRVAVSDPGSPNANSIEIQITAVPEPGSMLLLGSGLFGLAGVVRRRFKK